MEKTKNIQKTISKWAMIIAVAFAVIIIGVYAWHKISPYTYFEYINMPIIEWRINNLRTELIECNKKYGADKYLLSDQSSNKPGLLIRWRPDSKFFLPEFYHFGFWSNEDPFSPRDPALSQEEANKILSCIRDISPLKGMKLYGLSLSDTAVHDLEPLRGMPLKSLDISFTEFENSPQRVSDLSPLKGMKLTSLYLGNCPVKDISPLKGMKLERFRVVKTSISDISVLKGMPLKFVDLIDVPVKDLSPLKNAPLEILAIGNTIVPDLTPLFGKNLKVYLIPPNEPETEYAVGSPEEIQKYLNQSKKKQ